MNEQVIKGYHFTNGMKLRDGRDVPAKGRWLKHDGEVVPCVSGLHCSVEPRDALKFSPGSVLHQVELRGDLQSHGDPVDKWAGRERKIIASLDCEWLLRYFARQQALSVAHLWDAPDVILEYLITGDESIRDAALGAAWDAALGAAWDAAWDAALAAVRGAAWATARDAVRDAVRATARDAVRDAVRADFNALVEQAFAEEASYE